MSRAAFRGFGAARQPQSKATNAKDAAWRVERRDSGENQVVPFHLDDCADDNEEIRRRRYSSSYSFCQDEDDRSGRRRRAHKPSPGESDWEKASSQEPSSASLVDDEESDDDDEAQRVRVAVSTSEKTRNVREEPESPRKGRRKSQQSDDDDDGGNSGEEEEEIKPKATATMTNTTATALSGLGLSEISKLSVFPGSDGEAMVQGHVLRVKTLLGGSQYHYFIQDQLVLMAQKQLKNRTSNYHLFDMTRAVAGSTKLTKKSGNYVGKLRANFSRRKYVVVSNLRRRTELGAMTFEPTSTASEPRRLTVVLPPLSTKRREVEGLTVGDSSDSFSVLLDLLATINDDSNSSRSSKGADSEAIEAAVRHSPIPPDALQVYENKLPVFENGYYRLNFNGRVSVPSVKNFQLVARDRGAAPHVPPTSAADDKRVVLQFGKVDDKKFHLDFRAPVTPIQAFALALAQFNY